MSHLAHSEDPQTEEYDPDYTKELGNDLPAGAMSHPTS